jgi:TRAP-type C4-dicarboxylate transport system permease large subunit
MLDDVMSSAYQQAQVMHGIFSPKTVSVGDLFAGALLPGLLLVCYWSVTGLLLVCYWSVTGLALYYLSAAWSVTGLALYYLSACDRLVTPICNFYPECYLEII